MAKKLSSAKRQPSFALLLVAAMVIISAVIFYFSVTTVTQPGNADLRSQAANQADQVIDSDALQMMAEQNLEAIQPVDLSGAAAQEQAEDKQVEAIR